MEDNSIEVLLKNSAIFTSLDEDYIHYLAAKFEVIELSENEILFNQGDPSENHY